MNSWVEQLPSKRWRARYLLPSGEKRTAGTFDGKDEAIAVAYLTHEAAHSLGWRDPNARGKTWGEWCEAWWPTRAVSPATLARDKSPRTKHLMPKWGETPLIEITRHDVKSWAAQLRRDGLAPTSVQRIVHLFSGSLTAAIDAEILLSNPATRLALPHGQTDEMRFLTHEEAGALMGSADEFASPFLTLLLSTGLRWGEAAGLQHKRVDRARGQIRVAEVWDDKMATLKAYPKGRRIRSVPLSPDIRLPEGEGLVFGKLNYAYWRKRQWEPTLERSKLGHVRPHDLRHTYASWLVQKGTPLAEIGRLLGHVSPVTTQRYAHLVDTDNASVLAALPDMSAWGERGVNCPEIGLD
jgi:integrase